MDTTEPNKSADTVVFCEWPEPTEPMPDEETLIAWFAQDGGCEATDGCWVEGDGICQHGHPSWLLVLGMI